MDDKMSIEGDKTRLAPDLAWSMGRNKHREKRLRQQETTQRASFDGLTGLLNREAFELILENRLHSLSRKEEGEKGLAVIFLDMTGFKRFNDPPHSHEIGDSVLKIVAGALNDGIREKDTVGRWGGDEFIILIEDVKEDEVEKIVNGMEPGKTEFDLDKKDRIMDRINEGMRDKIRGLCDDGQIKWDEIGRGIPLEDYYFFARGVSHVGAEEYRDSGKNAHEWVQILTSNSDRKMYEQKSVINKAMGIDVRS